MAGGAPVPSDYTAKRIASLYAEVSKAIQNEINIAIASGNLDRADFLAGKRTIIRSILISAQDQAAQATTAEITAAYTESARKANKLLNKMGADVMKQAFNKADQRRLAILIDNATSKFEDITTLVGRRTDDILRRIALEQVTATNSLTGKETAAALENALTQAGVTTTADGGARLINVGGRNFELSHYAEMVARTTPREAATEAMKAAIQDNGYDLVEISSHTNSCDECEQYDGNTYSLSGNTPGYDTLDNEPPFHPNCGHVLTPAAVF